MSEQYTLDDVAKEYAIIVEKCILPRISFAVHFEQKWANVHKELAYIWKRFRQ